MGVDDLLKARREEISRLLGKAETERHETNRASEMK
jgi:hypothetical protein